ncbi:hypothetical protein WB388_18130 [Streptomyces brasiliscabiei]|uniref:Uncharacterized protein n=1 Tax=Streptomyces brasiliscabiei TaxID=2736302 RepID=A0ABU8GGZ1_9ACTN
MKTLLSQQQQIKEQREFIGDQRAFMAEQSSTLALERTELQAQAAERRVMQARSVEMRFETAGSTGRDERGHDTGYNRWDVTVSNNSDAPIHNVIVRFGETYNAGSAVEIEALHLPDGGRRVVPVHLIGGRRSVLFASGSWTEDVVDRNRPSLYFTDDAGIRWRRDESGDLKEQPPGAPSA